MAQLGTLVTMVTADTSGFTSGMTSAAQSAQIFEKKIKESVGGGVRGLSQELHHAALGLKGFNSLLELGFGFSVGTKIFGMLHEGLMTFVEGTNEAAKAGSGYFDSLVEGGKKVVGLKTKFEELNEHMKENADLAKKLGDLRGESDFDKAFRRVQELNKEAGPGRNKIAALKANLAEGQDDAQHGRLSLFNFTRTDIERKLKAAEEENAAKENAAREAEGILAEKRKELADDIERRARQQDHDDETEAYWNQLQIQRDAEIAAEKERVRQLEEDLKDGVARMKELEESERKNQEDRDEEAKARMKKAGGVSGGISGLDSVFQQLQMAALASQKPREPTKEEIESAKRLANIDDNGVKIRNVEMFALGTPA